MIVPVAALKSTTTSAPSAFTRAEQRNNVAARRISAADPRRYTCIRCKETESALSVVLGGNACAECDGLLVRL